ncbi:MAG: hypothetical protein QXS27_00425 [Candidatus Jordarchaeaceae archaeon]
MVNPAPVPSPVSTKKSVAVVLILLIIGLSAVFFGSYLSLVYTHGRDVRLISYPFYSTGRTFSDTLTLEKPNFTATITYYSLYDPIKSLFGLTPRLIGYLEADGNISFQINLRENPSEENPIFSVSNTNRTSFSVESKTDYIGFGAWELVIQKEATDSVNFSISYYQEIHGFANFIVSQRGNVISAAQLHMYNDSCWMFTYYESTILFTSIGGKLLLTISSLGGTQNPHILNMSYMLIVFGGATVLAIVLELIDRYIAKKRTMKEDNNINNPHKPQI